MAKAVIGQVSYLTLPDGRIIGFAVCRITPEIANEVTGVNYRNRRDHRVAYYARQMVAGMWQLTPQMLIFFENGERADGDHRLHGVVEAGRPQDLMVTWGWPVKITSVLDGILPRVTTDYLRTTLNLPWGNSEIGAMRLIAVGGIPTSNEKIVPNEVIADWALVLHDSIEFVRQHVKQGKSKQGIWRAEVIAVIAAAWYWQDRTKLTRFADGLSTGLGMDNNHEQVVYLLRNELRDKLAGKNDPDTRRRLLGLTLSALDKFMVGQTCQILRPARWDQALMLPAEISSQLTKFSSADIAGVISDAAG